jgi:hypothetical protein
MFPSPQRLASAGLAPRRIRERANEALTVISFFFIKTSRG